MKLRIKGNSIRLRLMQSEVAAFQQKGAVIEMTNFGTQKLIYQLKSTADKNVSAAFEGNIITVLLPKVIGLTWASSNQISIRASSDLPNGEQLTILIEKDFKCLTDRPDEDESDAYPHPSHDKC